MQLPGAQLLAHLQRGSHAVYTLHGDEALLVQEAADAVRAAARAQGHTERTVFTVAGAHFDWGSVHAAASARSLFADKQLLELRLPSGKPGKDGAQALQQLARSVGEAGARAGTLLLVLLPRLDGASQKSAWFAALDAHGVTLRIDPVERSHLPSWIAQRLKQQGQHVQAGEAGQRALAFMADRVEGHLLAAHQEIQKLGLLYPSGPLSAEDIESAVLNVARYDPFKLAEAVLDGQLARVQRMLPGLQAEGEAPVLVHWALADDIRSLWRVQNAVAGGRPLPLALREQRIWGAKEKRFERVLPRLTAPQVTQWLQDAHRVDGIVKGLKQPDWPDDPWLALHRLATQVCRACTPR